MVYTARQSPDFEGYAVKGSTIYHFQPDPAGDQIFASAVCPVDATQEAGAANSERLHLDFYFREFTPPLPGSPPGAHIPSSAIVNLIAGRSQFEIDVFPQLGRCTMRDQIAGRFTALELNRFRRETELLERVMRFPHSYKEVEAIAKARSKNGCARDLKPSDIGSDAGKSAIQ
jgi:hypothetical protein